MRGRGLAGGRRRRGGSLGARRGRGCFLGGSCAGFLRRWCGGGWGRVGFRLGGRCCWDRSWRRGWWEGRSAVRGLRWEKPSWASSWASSWSVCVSFSSFLGGIRGIGFQGKLGTCRSHSYRFQRDLGRHRHRPARRRHRRRRRRRRLHRRRPDRRRVPQHCEIWERWQERDLWRCALVVVVSICEWIYGPINAYEAGPVGDPLEIWTP